MTISYRKKNVEKLISIIVHSLRFDVTSMSIDGFQSVCHPSMDTTL